MSYYPLSQTDLAIVRYVLHQLAVESPNRDVITRCHQLQREHISVQMLIDFRKEWIDHDCDSFGHFEAIVERLATI